ncbi:MAG: hypothetical protein AB1757_30590 [Acidobacteriota bacterium]
MRGKLFLLLLVVFLVSGFTFSQQQTAPTAPDKLSRTEALGLIRTINTAEATANTSQQRYVSLETLLQNLAKLKSQYGIVLTNSDSATVKNYKLSLLVSEGGKHFKVSLQPQAGSCYSLFSDDSFVIYEGQPVGGNPTECFADEARK